MGWLPLGIYLHIPFCSSNCEYCNFFKEELSRRNIERFLAGIELEAKWFANNFANRVVDTIFWGGGSPSVLTANYIEAIGRSLLNNVLLKNYEWTVEISPLSIKEAKLLAMREIGVNRISIGVQSFDDATISALGRRQSVRQVYEAYDMVRRCGFTNVNIDLIFACPEQKLSDWQKDLDAAISLNPDHISTYCLSHEKEDGKFKKNNKFNFTEETREIEFYEFTRNYLQANEFEQYEISNFSKNGFQCKHNLNTWQMCDWIGFGPSAASQIGYKRYQNAFSLDKWLNGEKIEEINLNDSILLEDCLIFGLRTNAGVNLKKLETRFHPDNIKKYTPIFQSLMANNCINLQNNVITLTQKGQLLADTIALYIIS